MFDLDECLEKPQQYRDVSNRLIALYAKMQRCYRFNPKGGQMKLLQGQSLVMADITDQTISSHFIAVDYFTVTFRLKWQQSKV